MPPQTLDGYLKGAIPSADRALALADELKVDPRWLITGAGRARPDAEAESEVVLLPRYDLGAFGEYGKPEPSERIPVQRDWLGRWRSAADSLWLAESPGGVSDVADEGEALLCRDPDPHLVDGQVYIFLLDHRPLIRRVSLRPEGLTLKSGSGDLDPIVLRPDQAEHLIPIGRVLAALSLKPV